MDTTHAAECKRLLNAIQTADYALRGGGDLQTRPSVFTGKLLDANSRQADIEELIVAARAAGRKSEETLGLAALITEVGPSLPNLAIKLWQDNSTTLSGYAVAKAVSCWGLSLACTQLGRFVRALQYKAEAESIVEGLSDDEARGFRGLARVPNGEAPRASHEPAAAEPEPPFTALSTWLIRHRNGLTIGSFGYHFGAFATEDRHFVATAESQSQLVQAQLRQGLAKPANYLLHAAPGSGKSHFVRQFAKRLLPVDNFKDQYLERNLSAYASINDAFQDIVLDVLLALARHKPVLLFVDEVDTEINGTHMFQKLIAPMNGDDFFFHGKLLSFAKQNLVACYALSSRPDAKTPKWPDFLSRIPSEHRFTLPSLESPIERVFRALSSLVRHAEQSHNYRGVSFVSFQALLYIGLNSWTSARELDQALEMGLLRSADPNSPLDLEHIVVDTSMVLKTQRENNVSIVGADDFYVEVRPEPKAGGPERA